MLAQIFIVINLVDFDLNFTSLQLFAGLSKPTSGSIHVQRYQNDGNASQPPELLHPERAGIVFQFPER